MKKLILVLPLFLFLFLLEVLLRNFHEVLPSAASNFIASGYHIGPCGIYRYSPQQYMYVMKPNFQRDMYYNGYRWHHQTDASGFRNPTNRDRADIVLLGDSMIYGHGVEETDTVRAYLERSIGRPVMNMGMQGGSIHTEYQTFKNDALRFSPQFAFLFFLSNDIADLDTQLTRDQMQRFVSNKPGVVDAAYFDPHPLSIWRQDLAAFEGFYVARATFAAARLLWRRSIATALAAPVPVQQALPLELQFHLKALSRINQISRVNGIHLVHVFIDTGNAVFHDLEPAYKRVLERHSRRKEIPFVDLGRHFPADLQTKRRLFLSHDGRSSPAGAKRVAEIIAAYISDR